MLTAPLVGEPLALDLVNSSVRTPDGPLDLLADHDRLRQWVECQRDRLPDLPEEELADADVNAVHSVRDYASTAIEYARHAVPPSERDLRGLNEVLRAAPVTRELVHLDGATHVVTRRDGDRSMRLAARLAEFVANQLVDPAITRVRRCAHPICVVLFLPANPRRRWCSPKICGNRARVARYYYRTRASGSARSSGGSATV